MTKLPDGWLADQRDPDLAAAEQALVDARQRLDEAGDKARAACDHKVIVEAPYYASDWGSSLPPFRVCARCGFHERGWGCGFHALADTAERMVIDADRAEAHRLATEPERVSGWWIIPVGRTEPRDPYKGYPDD